MNQVVLVVAAHPDDEVLGCGGTLARWADAGWAINVLFMTDGVGARSGPGQELGCQAQDRRRAAERAATVLGIGAIEFLDFPDNRMDSLELLTVVKEIEYRLERISPQIVLTHHVGDVNIDHQVVHQATITACRPRPDLCVKELMFFEIASSTEWRPSGSAFPFVPDTFVDISETLPRKLDALKAYDSEIRPFPHPRSQQGVESLAKWRGATIGRPAAEAFILGRRVL